MPWTPPLTGAPYPCPVCRESIRAVRATDGVTILTITADPHPEGTVIPWPAPTVNDVAQARVLTAPPVGEPAWLLHRCR